MKPLTEAMKSALLRGDLGMARGSYSSLMALASRELCSQGSLARINPGVWSSKLTHAGQSQQLQVRIEGGDEILKVFRDKRRNRLHNHPALRTQRAIEAAIEVAMVVKGGSLTPAETRMIDQAVSRVIDVLEAGTRRVYLCPHGDYVVVGGEDAQARDCPVHGRVLHPGPLGTLEGGILAVLYDARQG